MAEETRAAGSGRSIGLSDEMRAKAREYPEWEADVIALPATVADSRSYQTATLVCAGPIVVGLDQTACRNAEPDQVAELIERALTAAAESVGMWPEAVVVRHREIAAALGARFERGRGPLGRGDRPEALSTFYLDHLDAPARELVAHLAGEEIWPPLAAVPTWAAWGLPEPDIEALLAAAAAYYRAAPWQVLDDVPPLTASWPDGDEWTLAVLGAGGVARGLGVYADVEDYDAALRVESPAEALEHPGNWVIGLYFVDRGELPRPMQREMARSGWDVAAPDAYPVVAPILTPAGGLPGRIARRLTEVLAGVVSLVETEGAGLERGEPTTCEAPGGLRMEYPGEDPDGLDAYDGLPAELHAVVDDIRAGTFATQEEAERAFEARVTALNATPRADLSGLSPIQAQALLDGEWDGTGPLRLAHDLSLDDLAGADFLHNARTLLAAANDAGGAPATAAGNLKRAFVADVLERMRWPEGELDMIRDFNKVINEGDVPLLHRLRVVLDVAGLLQRRKGLFRVTARGNELLDDGAAGRLMAHLFRAYFREFNIGYVGRGPDTATIQHLIPLILARLPHEASEWIDRDELAGALLPPERPGSSRGAEGAGLVNFVDVRRIQLAVHVLKPLARFGLLEERLAGGRWPFGQVEVRVAGLFGRFIRVSFG